MDKITEKPDPHSASSLSMAPHKEPSEGSSYSGLEEGGKPETTKAEEQSLEQDPGELGTQRKIIIVLALCICTFLAALDQTIITTAIPAIAAQFNAPWAYTWIGSAYLLASASCMPSWGKFSDIWGRKPAILSAAAIFLVGSILCAAAQNIGMMLAGRAIQGVGAGGQLSLVNVTISDLVAVRQRGIYLSFVGFTWAFASAIGPVLGGVFTDKTALSWRWNFIINMPIGLVGITGIVMFLHLESPRITLYEGLQRVDWLGTFFIATGVVLFLLGLQLGGVSHPWSSPVVLCCLIFGVASLVIFIFVEWKVAKLPLMPLRLFSQRTQIFVYLVGLTHGQIYIAGCYFLPVYFQSARGASPLLSGVYVLPFVFVLSLLSGASGWIVSKTGRYQELIWSGTFIMTIGVGLLINLDRTSSWAKIVIYQLIAGIGCGPLFQTPLIALHSTIDSRDIATATTTFQFLRVLGTSLAVSLGLVVFQNEMQQQSEGLEARLGPQVAALISGSSASASIEYVRKTLHGAQQTIAQDAYAKGLSTMWYFFLGISAVCFLLSLGIGRHHLSREPSPTQPLRKRSSGVPKLELA